MAKINIMPLIIVEKGKPVADGLLLRDSPNRDQLIRISIIPAIVTEVQIVPRNPTTFWPQGSINYLLCNLLFVLVKWHFSQDDEDYPLLFKRINSFTLFFWSREKTKGKWLIFAPILIQRVFNFQGFISVALLRFPLHYRFEIWNCNTP